jgi:ChrR-like protein with cupin domain
MMRRSRVISAAAGVLLLAVSSVAMAAKSGKAVKSDVVWSADALKWEDGPLKGTHVAKLWGDWMKGGPYGVLIKFDAGLMNPLHKHTQTLKIVVLSGTFIHHPEGGVETKLGPGSYLLQAGGKNHVSGCADGAECEFFMTSADKFDLIQVKAPPAGKK